MLCLPPLFPPSWPVVIAVLVQIIVYFAIAEFIFTYQSETMKCFWKYIDTRMRGELWGRYVFSSSNLQVSFRSSEFHYLRAHANFGFWTMQEHSFRSILLWWKCGDAFFIGGDHKIPLYHIIQSCTDFSLYFSWIYNWWSSNFFFIAVQLIMLYS